MNYSIPCTIMRGGTSKGIYLLDKDLPTDEALRSRLLLRLMGSPDSRQIDGLGGAAAVTSKVAIVSGSSRNDADIDYTFAQVSIDKPLVSFMGNCGNISSGVGPFAIEHGLVPATAPITYVRVYNTNTRKIIVEEVLVRDGHPLYDGDYEISGVPGRAAPIKMTFLSPQGSVSGQLLPTGHTKDTLIVPGLGPVEVSIVDAANPLVFAKASDLGLSGMELPLQLEAKPDKLNLLETLRGLAAVKMGLIHDYRQAPWESPGIPKMTIISAPGIYTTTDGLTILPADMDIMSRMMSMQKPHPTYAMTGAMCTAAAAVIPGTVVHEVLSPDHIDGKIRIGHPGGVLEAGVEYGTRSDGSIDIINTYGYRTANLIMTGNARINLT